MKNTSQKPKDNGDTYFDIHIAVDKISNDYDVEQMASKVKKLIVSDANYRNNNIVNRLR